MISLFRLLPVAGGLPIEVVSQSVVLGRSRFGCDVRVDHHSVSRQHCELTWSEGILVVRDLGSRNGTRINGRLVSDAPLRSGDELMIGSCRFVLELAESNSSR